MAQSGLRSRLSGTLPISIAIHLVALLALFVVPLVANIVEDGKTPLLSAQEFGALGFKILLYPISALLAVTRRLETAYEQLLKGERKELDTNRATFNHYNAIMKLPELLAVTKALARTNYEE